MVKISVIVTTFNSEKCIVKTLNSVLSQEGLDNDFAIELIVVDDCSVDETVNILRTFPVDLYFQNPSNSGGPNKGRNIGLRHATGDFICFLDHDDVWHPTKLAAQLSVAHMASIITCGYSTENPHKEVKMTRDKSRSETLFFMSNATFHRKLSKEKKQVQNTYLSTIMIHKDLRRILFEENFGMVDFDWILRLFENRCSVEVPVNLVSRTVGEDNLSLQRKYRNTDYYFSLLVLEDYKGKYPREVFAARKRINGSRARYHYLMGEMPEARRYLLRAMPGLKECGYLVTSFLGSDWIRRNFPVFG